ncbi:KH domain-containing protein [Rivularia sp. UHCC 0363]|uniref:KH domain-containing protein n=1 Tax=Rivularia sp. UHCC 0363 TaxID=3110244 RepID=UPI002B1FA2BB|nr:KH domain-containing protein [Rivularia sp. UHCC 0363]MEA5597876.1 KH domain-containing protein [Rivularia sp. UHCC 0363]
MFLNKSVQKLYPHNVGETNPRTIPNYIDLVKFLIEPFLESPESLSVDCEISSSKRAWIRIAFDNADKGKVFGRGGRNIQAIRTVISAAAQVAEQSAYLDVYGSNDRIDAPASTNTTDTNGEERNTQLPMPKPKVRQNDRPTNFTQPRTRI